VSLSQCEGQQKKNVPERAADEGGTAKKDKEFPENVMTTRGEKSVRTGRFTSG